MKCFIFIYSFNIFIGKYSININILCFLFRYIVRFVIWFLVITFLYLECMSIYTINILNWNKKQEFIVSKVHYAPPLYILKVYWKCIKFLKCHNSYKNNDQSSYQIWRLSDKQLRRSYIHTVKRDGRTNKWTNWKTRFPHMGWA